MMTPTTTRRGLAFWACPKPSRLRRLPCPRRQPLHPAPVVMPKQSWPRFNKPWQHRAINRVPWREIFCSSWPKRKKQPTKHPMDRYCQTPTLLLPRPNARNNTLPIALPRVDNARYYPVFVVRPDKPWRKVEDCRPTTSLLLLLLLCKNK